VAVPETPAVPVAVPVSLPADSPAAPADPCQAGRSKKSPFRVNQGPLEAQCAEPGSDTPAQGTETATAPAQLTVSATDPPLAPVPSADEIKALLRADPPAETGQLEAALDALENSPGSEDDVFLLVRVLSKREPKYKLRLGAFFDPTDTREKGSVTPNVKYAYDEYLDSGLPESKAQIDRLVEWSKKPEANGAEGLAEFKAAVN
jgi:hypothetical protein